MLIFFVEVRWASNKCGIVDILLVDCADCVGHFQGNSRLIEKEKARAFLASPHRGISDICTSKGWGA